MKAADFARRGITLSLVGGGLGFHCDRGITSAEKQLVAEHKAELLAELQGPKSTMAEVLIREASTRGWEVEMIHQADRLSPLPREIQAELMERGFSLSRVSRMTHGEAIFHLFRDGGSRWE